MYVILYANFCLLTILYLSMHARMHVSMCMMKSWEWDLGMRLLFVYQVKLKTQLELITTPHAGISTGEGPWEFPSPNSHLSLPSKTA